MLRSLAVATEPSLPRRGLIYLAIDPNQEFLVQPVDASWLQCNIECQEACPVGTNCRGYLNLAAEGRFEEGYILSREPNPVAAMCAYVCSAPCERACRRGDIDRPLAIRAMKRFLVEWHQAVGHPRRHARHHAARHHRRGRRRRPRRPRRGARAGRRRPPGDRLRRAALSRGGTMLIGVPAFRLPREAIEMDFRLVERLGVTLPVRHAHRPGHHLRAAPGALRRHRHLRRRHGRGRRWTCPAATSTGIQYGVDFMKKANLGEPLEVGQDVVIIGGGYTAMDCSRTSLRHGAENVTIAYRRTRSELVVDEEELGETEREGVRMEFLVSPVEVLGDEDGNVARRALRPQPPGRAGRHRPPRARCPIAGHASSWSRPRPSSRPSARPRTTRSCRSRPSFEINRGRVRVDPGTYATNVRGVFACGDFVTGPTTLIESAGHGKKCAYAIDRYLSGRLDGRGRRQRAHRQLLAPRDARVLRRPAARSTCPWSQLAARMPSTDPHGQLHDPRRAGLHAPTRRSPSRTRCLMCNYNIWFDALPLRPLRRLRGRLPRGRHPHDRRQPDEVGGAAAGAGRRLRLEPGRGHGPRRGALHPLRAVRQAMPVRRHHHGAVRAAGDQQRTVGSTRRATATPSWGWRASATRPRQGDSQVRVTRQLSFLERIDEGIRRSARLALALPPALPQRRAIARHGGHEQRVPAHPPGAGPPARGQVRLHLLPGRPVVLLLPGADRDRRLPDVLLRALGDVRPTRTSCASRRRCPSGC